MHLEELNERNCTPWHKEHCAESTVLAEEGGELGLCGLGVEVLYEQQRFRALSAGAHRWSCCYHTLERLEADAMAAKESLRLHDRVRSWLR